MGTTVAELKGVVAELVNVVKDLTTNVNHVTQTIGEMAQAVLGAPNSDNTQGLRMPSIFSSRYCGPRCI